MVYTKKYIFHDKTNNDKAVGDNGIILSVVCAAADQTGFFDVSWCEGIPEECYGVVPSLKGV